MDNQRETEWNIANECLRKIKTDDPDDALVIGYITDAIRKFSILQKEQSRKVDGYIAMPMNEALEKKLIIDGRKYEVLGKDGYKYFAIADTKRETFDDISFGHTHSVFFSTAIKEASEVKYGDYVQMNDRFETVVIWSKEVEEKCNRPRYEGSVAWTPRKITKEFYDDEMQHSWNKPSTK